MTTAILGKTDVATLSQTFQNETAGVRKLILDRVDDADDDAVIAHLAQLIAKSTKLDTVCLLRRRLSEASIKTLFEEGLSKCASLKCLYLCTADNPATTSALISSLSKLLRRQKLEQLRLRDCHLKDRHVIFLARKGLKYNTTLQKLMISRNPRLTDKGATSLFEETLRHPSSSLETLDLSYNAISMTTPETTNALLLLSTSTEDRSTRRRPLLSLNLHGNERIGTGGGDGNMILLCKALASNPPIQSLSLSRCGIDYNGLQHLGEALKFNTTLKCLELKSNLFDSVQTLVEDTILPYNMTLERIVLDHHDSEKTLIGLDQLEMLLEWNRLGRRQCLLQQGGCTPLTELAQRILSSSQEEGDETTICIHPLSLLFMTLRQTPDLMSVFPTTRSTNIPIAPVR